MTDTSDLRIDCQTCLAANTTACGECVVTHLLANDDGPIEYHATELVAVLGHATSGEAEPTDPIGDAVSLLAKAGLVDDPPVWVDRSTFDAPRRLSVVR